MSPCLFPSLREKGFLVPARAFAKLKRERSEGKKTGEERKIFISMKDLRLIDRTLGPPAGRAEGEKKRKVQTKAERWRETSTGQKKNRERRFRHSKLDSLLSQPLSLRRFSLSRPSSFFSFLRELQKEEER